MTRQGRAAGRVRLRWPRWPRWPVGAGLALAAVVRLAHWWAVRGAPFVGELVMDSQEYDRWARSLADGGWLGHGAFFQAPFYPYLVGALYTLVGPRPDAVYLLQIAVAVCGLWALGRAAGDLGGPGADGARREVAVVFLGALCGPLVFHDVQLLKESFAASAVAFLLLALVRARVSGSWRSWLGAGILLGLLSELRENALLLAPLLALLALPGPPGRPDGMAGRADQSRTSRKIRARKMNQEEASRPDEPGRSRGEELRVAAGGPAGGGVRRRRAAGAGSVRRPELVGRGGAPGH